MLPAAICLLLLPLSDVSAFSAQAGSCKSGTAVSSSHMVDDTGPLSKAGYQVVIDEMLLSSDSSSNLTAGQDHSISLQADDTVDGFRGFLIRLSGAQGEDVSPSFLISEGYDDVKMLSNCEETVAGLSHTSNSLKKSVSSAFLAPCDVSQLLLEVTAVRENRGGANDGWYYNSYTINVDGNCTSTNTTDSPEDDASEDSNLTSGIENNSTSDDVSVENSSKSGATRGRLIVPCFIIGIMSLFWG
mmetsp:Transcript_40102/g.48872  ORF Transcript_40102/g.48872 Transcript_40102/m.48872 type:complete len:244 (-) Transcript_40102:207-938(-)